MLIDRVDNVPDQKPTWQGVRLQKEEHVMQEFQASFFIETIYWWLAIFLSLGLALPFFVAARWARKRHRWALTNQRIISRLGIFNRISISLEYNDAMETKVERPFLAGVLGNGRVKVESRSGGENAELVIWRQHDPDLVRDSIESAKKMQRKKEKSIEEQVYNALLKARGIQSPRPLSEDVLLALEAHSLQPSLEDNEQATTANEPESY